MSNTVDSNKLTPPEEKNEDILQKNLSEGSIAVRLGKEATNRMASDMRKTLASMRYSLYRMRGGTSR